MNTINYTGTIANIELGNLVNGIYMLNLKTGKACSVYLYRST